MVGTFIIKNDDFSTSDLLLQTIVLFFALIYTVNQMGGSHFNYHFLGGGSVNGYTFDNRPVAPGNDYDTVDELVYTMRNLFRDEENVAYVCVVPDYDFNVKYSDVNYVVGLIMIFSSITFGFFPLLWILMCGSHTMSYKGVVVFGCLTKVICIVLILVYGSYDSPDQISSFFASLFFCFGIGAEVVYTFLKTFDIIK